MKLNPGKCKITVSFSCSRDCPPALRIDGKVMEQIQSYKLLSLTFQWNLTRNVCIMNMISKASKHLNILCWCFFSSPWRLLYLIWYLAILHLHVQSLSTAPRCESLIPEFLLDEHDRVEKQTVRILYSDSQSNEALSFPGCCVLNESLNVCNKTFKKICNPILRCFLRNN